MNGDCEARLGLSARDLQMLTGFTDRAFRALAHLREAWVAADSDNAIAIEEAIKALMRGHSFANNREMVIRILSFGIDEPEAKRFLRIVGVRQ